MKFKLKLKLKLKFKIVLLLLGREGVSFKKETQDKGWWFRVNF